jgi:hypothetical protein
MAKWDQRCKECPTHDCNCRHCENAECQEKCTSPLWAEGFRLVRRSCPNMQVYSPEHKRKVKPNSKHFKLTRGHDNR